MSNLSDSQKLISAPIGGENEFKKVLPHEDIPLTGTVFMGPLSHREGRVEEIIHAQSTGKWSEEVEAAYMENVRKRATTKVRAMLLQAKRRSDEIVAEAEAHAQKIMEETKDFRESLHEQQAQAQHQLENAYAIAEEKATQDALAILQENQKALGESTAVVLLSIHQQLQNLYDAWREELRLLTLGAIEAGTGWIAEGAKENILSNMLDECVRNIIDKSNFIVRVHPSDGALVTQVLENSKEKSWSMETSHDLEPGSLELESKHVMVKNNSHDRAGFVKNILDNLVLPKKPMEEDLVQNVTNTLMNEMEKNPLLSDNPEPIQDELPSHTSEVTQEMIMPNMQDNMQNPKEDITGIQEHMAGIHEGLTEMQEDMAEMIAEAPELNVQAETEELVDSFLSDDDEIAKELAQSMANEEAQALPSDVADDLLSEMGFDEDKNS